MQGIIVEVCDLTIGVLVDVYDDQRRKHTEIILRRCKACDLIEIGDLLHYDDLRAILLDDKGPKYAAYEVVKLGVELERRENALVRRK